MENTVNTDLIRDHVDSFILRFLAEGDSYGYDIHKAISTATEGVYVIKQPTLYSCLKRLEKQGFITSYDGETSNGAQRKYYSITDKGRDFLNVDIEQWTFSRTLLDRLLSDKQIDLATVPHPFDPSELRPRTRRGTGVAAVADADSDPIQETEEDPDLSRQSSEPQQDAAPSESPTVELEVAAAENPLEQPKFGNNSLLHATQLDIDSFMEENEPASDPQQAEPLLQRFLDQHLAENEDYLSSLNALFDPPAPLSAPSSLPETESEEQQEDFSTHNPFNYGELRELAQSQGYRLSPYSKSVSTSYYSMNFIFSSRLRRDSLLLLYLVMFAEVLISFFAFDRYVDLGYVFYIVVACLLLLCPIVGIVLYLMRPDKRIRAEFDLKSSISGMIMLSINLFIFSMLLAFFLFSADLGRPVTMIKPILYPALLFIDLPIYTLIYAALYNTHRYHLK